MCFHSASPCCVCLHSVLSLECAFLRCVCLLSASLHYVCFASLCVFSLCVPSLCVSSLCVPALCVPLLCVPSLCVCSLCVLSFATCAFTLCLFALCAFLCYVCLHAVSVRSAARLCSSVCLRFGCKGLYLIFDSLFSSEIKPSTEELRTWLLTHPTSSAQLNNVC